MLNNEPLVDGDSRFFCSSVYHLVRLTGLGSDYVLPLYEISMRVGYKSGRFFPRMTELAPYLNCHQNQLYNAARLLVESGFWIKVTDVRGKAVEYHPLDHHDWCFENLEKAEATCCKKLTMPWDEEEQDPLAKALYGATGGCIFYPNVLKGWRAKSGLTDDAIVERAKQFMETPESSIKSVDNSRQIGDPAKYFGHKKGPAFRRRLGAFICSAAAKETK